MLATSLDSVTSSFVFVGSDGVWPDVVAVRAQCVTSFSLTVRAEAWFGGGGRAGPGRRHMLQGGKIAVPLESQATRTWAFHLLVPLLWPKVAKALWGPPPLPNAPLQEIGVQTGPCTQWATVDLGALYALDTVRTRVWSPDSATVTLMTSADGNKWASTPLNPQLLSATNTTMDGTTPVRCVCLCVCARARAGINLWYVSCRACHLPNPQPRPQPF